MNTSQILQTLEFNLYCLRAWNISAYEREQAIKETREAIEYLTPIIEPKP